jgi:hypothetical protein
MFLDYCVLWLATFKYLQTVFITILNESIQLINSNVHIPSCPVNNSKNVTWIPESDLIAFALAVHITFTH